MTNRRSPRLRRSDSDRAKLLNRARDWLVGEQERLARRLAAEADALSEHLSRVAERDPCAYRSPVTAAEDDAQARRLAQHEAVARELRAVEAAKIRLDTQPETYGRCIHCDAEIGEARLELLPQTTACAPCASRQS